MIFSIKSHFWWSRTDFIGFGSESGIGSGSESGMGSEKRWNTAWTLIPKKKHWYSSKIFKLKWIVKWTLAKPTKMKHRHVNRFTVLHIHRYRYTHRPSRLMHFDDYSLSKYTKSAVIVLCICKQTLQNRVAKEMRDRKRCQHTNALEFLIRNRSLLLGFLGKVIRIKLRTKAKMKNCTEQQQQQQQQLRVNK